ncbi:MAG: 3-phosphoshikimate 1-carboxyvinyltransferase [Patescibacteria group bacterium]
MFEIVPPVQPLSGSVTLPGSKSITNRALLLAALAAGESQITGALKSDDTKFMVEGLRKLGIKIAEPDETTFVVQGRGGKLTESPEPLFLGNAGTATRFLAAAASLVIGETVITGNERMNKRPIEDLTSALAQLGVKVETNEGCTPVKIISTGKLTGQVVKIRGNVSSQFVSALLMLLPNAAEEIRLELEGELTSKGYVDITTAVMAGFGVIPLASNNGFKIPHKTYSATNFAVEPDASSATYFWAAEKLLGQTIMLTNVPQVWIQPDAESRQLMIKFPEPFGTVDGSRFPDAVVTLAVLAAFANGQTRFTNIANLRVKECDRIVAIATELNRIKPDLAEEDGDDLVIHGDRDLVKHGKPTEITTYGDHRIAMAFALVGLKVPGIKITNPACVSKSFPDYFETLENLGVTIKK